MHGQIAFDGFQYKEYCANEDFLVDGWSTCFERDLTLVDGDFEKTDFAFHPLWPTFQCGRGGQNSIPECKFCQGSCRDQYDCDGPLVCLKAVDVKSTSQCSIIDVDNPFYTGVGVCVVDKTSVSIESFDRAIELVFGKMTTIGQICAYADDNRGVNEPEPPGFCCLEAPYESDNNWGEMVRNQIFNREMAYPLYPPLTSYLQSY